MAVFVCCVDESVDRKPPFNFFYGGFVAPVNDWEGSFAPAWTEHVLGGNPSLEFLHTSELMIPQCREKLGISLEEVEKRLDEAASVIHTSGSLIPVVVHFKQATYERLKRLVPRKMHTGLEEPDYLAFLQLAFVTLKWIHTYRRDDVDTVDLWVEEHDKISKRVGGFARRLRESLIEVGAPELASLVGEFQEVSKKRIPAQAADILGWHARNNQARRLTLSQGKRYNAMVVKWLDQRGNREGIISDGDDFVAEMRERYLRDFGEESA